VQFPFGFGLSYSTFSIDSITTTTVAHPAVSQSGSRVSVGNSPVHVVGGAEAAAAAGKSADALEFALRGRHNSAFTGRSSSSRSSSSSSSSSKNDSAADEEGRPRGPPILFTDGSGPSLTVTVSVSNHGPMPGDVVMQAYMLPPAFPVTKDRIFNDDVVPPKRSMVAYQRLRGVGVGTTSHAVFNINAKDMLLATKVSCVLLLAETEVG
jgi:hypothetical protein